MVQSIPFIHILETRFGTLFQYILNFLQAIMGVFLNYLDEWHLIFRVYLVYLRLMLQQDHNKLVLTIQRGVQDRQGFRAICRVGVQSIRKQVLDNVLSFVLF